VALTDTLHASRPHYNSQKSEDFAALYLSPVAMLRDSRIIESVRYTEVNLL
jgi:hypothetical protein